MRRDLIEALDESLTLLGEGQITLEECLARHPEHAADLRPLLEIAGQIRSGPRSTSSSAAFAAGKRRMLERLAERQRRLPRFPAFVPRLAEWVSALFGRIGGPAARRRRTIVGATLVGVLVLALCFFGTLSLLFWPGRSVAQAATLERVKGVVEVLPDGSDLWRPASQGGRLVAGDQIRVGPQSAATLALFDGSSTDLGAETEISIIAMRSRRDGGHRVVVLRQALGWTYSRVQPLPDPSSRFEIECPAGTATVRGTEFAASVGADGTTNVAVIVGLVEVTGQEVTIPVSAGQEARVEPEKPPALVPATPTQEDVSASDDTLPAFEHPVATLLGSYFGVEADAIAGYREQEVGFGVLVKLYAIADEFGVPMEELVAAFRSGTGMGKIFQEYGRPSVFAPGHLKGKEGGPPEHAGPPDHAGSGENDGDEHRGPPEHAGPEDRDGKPEHPEHPEHPQTPKPP